MPDEDRLLVCNRLKESIELESRLDAGLLQVIIPFSNLRPIRLGCAALHLTR